MGAVQLHCSSAGAGGVLSWMDDSAAACLESYAADRAALLQYVLESPAVAGRVLWPSADRNALDAVQILGHPIDLNKVDVRDVYVLLCKDLAIFLADISRSAHQESPFVSGAGCAASGRRTPSST